MKPSNAKPVDSGTLSGHLWEAANILRGPVDAADFKTYIFPLLFFKRLSDVYDAVALMVRILAPAAGETIYDPACGTGGMLLEALHYVKAHGGDEHTMLGKLYGQEKNLTTSAIARMNLFLHGAEDFHIERGGTLRLPAFYAGDSLATFDCVIANPPFSLEKWGEDVWLNDPYGRNFAGLPPAQSGDFAWVQHMLTSMAPRTGRMAVVLPHGVLFRMSSAQGDQDGEIILAWCHTSLHNTARGKPEHACEAAGAGAARFQQSPKRGQDEACHQGCGRLRPGPT